MTPLEFIHLCSSASARAFTPAPTTTKAEDALIARLKALLTPDPDEEPIPMDELNRFRSALTYHLILTPLPEAKETADALRTLNAVLGAAHPLRDFEHPNWTEALSLLKGFNAYSDKYSRTIGPDETADRAEAARQLRDQHKVTVTIDGTYLRFGGLDQVYRKLDTMVSNIGGQFFIEYILTRFLTWNDDLKRLILPKTGNNPSLATPPRALPVNYMLNVGLKHLSSPGYSCYSDPRYISGAIELFQLVAFATYEVQNYTIWPNLIPTGKNPLDYIRDLIYRESVFDLHQSSAPFIRDYIRFIYDHSRHFLPAEYKELYSLYYKILDQSDPNLLITLNTTELNKRQNKLLTKISIEAGELNRGFAAPTDYSEINFWNYPLVKLTEDKYLILPTTIAARCCLESMLQYARTSDPGIDSKMGNIIEQYLTEKIKRRGGKLLEGEYTLTIPDGSGKKTISGECDGLLETSRTICLFEDKKKSLIRQSRTGDDLSILKDIALSLLASQNQGLRTEIALRQGPLQLLKKGTKEVTAQVELANRHIQRISVSMLPFGDIQDRALILNILKILYINNFSYDSDDPSKLDDEGKAKLKAGKKTIKDIEKKQEQFRQFIDILAKLKIDTKVTLHPDRVLHDILFDSWFMDLEQLYHLLRESKDIESFDAHLRSLGHLTTGTHDFYNEYLLLRNLQPQGN